MGYQAFLFCVDEKLARVVSQLFSELEFSVTSLNDPFAAVKSLMAQHYDAVVLDCENEQSASLLIKSARNSTFNQGSLAIALVEGQAGVAKAYRMGANLVLTKPINVEQSKGTLRVARGLLRKGSEAATHASSAVPDKPAAFPPGAPTHQYEEAPVAHTAQNAAPQYESHDSSGTNAPATPAPAFAKSEEAPAHAPAAQTKAWTALAGQAPFVQPQSAPAPIPAAQGSAQRPASEQAAIKAEAPKPAVVPFVNATPKSHGAASAPAPAKEVVAPAQPAHDGEGREEFPEDAPFHAPQAASSRGAEASAGPLFSAAAEQTGGSGGSQKILIGAVAVFLLIAAYFGWTKFGPSHSTPAPAPTSVAATPQTPAQAPSNVSSTPSPAAQVPSAAANHTTATTAPGHTTSSVQPGHPAADVASTTQAAAVSQSTETKTAPAPILVKPGAAARTRQTQPPSQTEDASAQPPSALGIVSPGEGSLSGVLAANAAKPTLARVRISQGVSQGLLIKQVPPKYPSNAIAMRAQGAVQIEATVDKEGRVVNPKVVSGSSLLAPAALEAVRQWRYKPYYLDGEPVEIQTQITINFKTQ